MSSLIIERCVITSQRCMDKKLCWRTKDLQISQIIRWGGSQLQNIYRCQFPTLGNGRSQTLQRSNDYMYFKVTKVQQVFVVFFLVLGGRRGKGDFGQLLNILIYCLMSRLIMLIYAVWFYNVAKPKRAGYFGFVTQLGLTDRRNFWFTVKSMGAILIHVLGDGGSKHGEGWLFWSVFIFNLAISVINIGKPTS